MMQMQESCSTSDTKGKLLVVLVGESSREHIYDGCRRHEAAKVPLHRDHAQRKASDTKGKLLVVLVGESSREHIYDGCRRHEAAKVPLHRDHAQRKASDTKGKQQQGKNKHSCLACVSQTGLPVNASCT